MNKKKKKPLPLSLECVLVKNTRKCQGNKKIFRPNKTCRQEFPQTFQVRSKHRECQPIQELGEKRKIKGFIYLL